MTAAVQTILPPAPLEAWQISEGDYPVEGRAADKLRFLLRYAVLAPSSHNTQPWLFRVRDDAVELYADRSRGLPVVDPDDRQLIMSCGAALLHLRIAIRHFGHAGEVTLFPDTSDPDLLARVRLGRVHPPTGEEEEIFHAIPRRRTNRLAFEPRLVDQAVLFQLRVEARAEGAWLHILQSEDERNRVADLVAEGDRIEWADRRFRRELASWMHPNASSSCDGMRGYGFGHGDLMSRGGPFFIRTFDLGGQTAASDRRIAAGSPALAVLGTDGDWPYDWLAAGQALARVLLMARAHEVWASFLNQPVELPDLRSKLCDLCDGYGYPQMLMRLGYGRDVRPEPRRPVDEVLMPEVPVS
jgi:nitroreductase